VLLLVVKVEGCRPGDLRLVVVVLVLVVVVVVVV
jgi:hypothetical protein